MRPTPHRRTEAFAQGYAPSLTDRFGVWLSARQIRRWVPSFAGKRVADLGCGFHASFARTILDEVGAATLVDVALADDLKRHPKVHAIEGTLPEALAPLAGRQPRRGHGDLGARAPVGAAADAASRSTACSRPGGICLVNVPSWRGKRYLELSAFKLGFSPTSEMDDHKMYYDVRDLWPLLVQAGFLPSRIQCFTHKFGLNTFAACTKPAIGAAP